MQALPSIAGLSSLSDATLTTLRQRFEAVGFDEALLAAGEAIAPGMLDVLRLPFLHAAWMREPTPARDLALVFAYEGALDAARIEAALGGKLFEALLGAGLLEREGDAVRSPFQLIPMLGLCILGDDLHRGEDAVMGPGATTIRLGQAMPRQCPARVLDVGCGAGSFALLAALRGATEAVGVDIAPRAVELSRFNARLNGLSARFEVSDMFSAVEGERFDLIASQPAFIARAPDVRASTFAHGGPMGDELVMRLFEGLAAHLRPGGAALVLLESAVRPAAPLHVRLREAIGRAPLDLLLLAAKGHDPDSFSMAYASLVDPTLGPAWRDAALRYRAHLRAMGVDEFTHALALVAAPAQGATAARYTITLPVSGLRGFDADTLQGLQTGLALATSDDATVLAATVRARDGALYVEERSRPDSSLEPRWVVRFPRVAFAERELSDATWVLLGILDGAATVREAVEGYAEACGATAPEVRAQVLAFVRESLARGLLVPA